MATIAGTGTPGSSGDGGLATAATLAVGSGLAVDAAGNIYFGDATAHAVRRIRPDGVIESYATGLGAPNGLAFDDAGNLYVADDFVHIKRIDPAGTVTIVAGTGVSGSSGNDGPALDAQIQAAGLAIGPRGDLYFDDLNNYRTIDPQGIIHAFAGSVTPGFSGDGGPAVDASFGDSVTGIAPDGQGNVYLGDSANLRIRKVDATGTITTFAGNGKPGHGGDNGPAIDATLMPSQYGMAIDPAGNLYFTDWQTASVRRIDTAGIITTVAGSGASGSLGDCGPATAALLSGPIAVAVHDGAIFIADSQNNRIRMVVP
jgi:streptogramin lyase